MFEYKVEYICFGQFEVQINLQAWVILQCDQSSLRIHWNHCKKALFQRYLFGLERFKMRPKSNLWLTFEKVMIRNSIE